MERNQLSKKMKENDYDTRESKYLILALYGASGKTIERFFSIVDKELARVLFEDLQNVMDSEVDEKIIIEAQLTVLNLLRE